jgi:mono/diheme cytochrome c family protein
MDDFSKGMIDKFKGALEHKGRLFGLIYPYIFTIMFALGLLYVTNLNEIYRRSVLPAVPDTTVVTDIPVVEPRTVPPVDIKTAGIQTPEYIDKGKALYTTVCASCHGENGTGDGAAAAGLNPAPRNFRSPDNWKNGPKLPGIYKTLEEGIPGSGMISYNYLTPEERIGIAHYIRSTFVPNAPVDTPEELTNLDLTYNLSQGKEIAAQIPVGKALQLTLEENKSNVQQILQKLNIMSQNQDDPGYRIFDEITINKLQAAAVLNNSSKWKESQDEFISLVLGNVNTVTFSRKANTLGTEDWVQLQSFMSRYF